MGERVRAFAGLVALGLVALVGVAAVTGQAGTPAQGPAGTHPAAAGAAVRDVAASSEGRLLYLQGCAACHGAAGEGTSSGPSLADAGAAGADFMLRTGRMPLSGPGDPVTRKPPAFTDEQIDALVAYVASLGQGPPIPQVVTSQGDLRLGRQLFIGNCAACHSAAGAGNSVGGGFVAPALDQATPAQVGEAMRTGPGVMPVFDPAAFPDQAVDSIAAYVVSLREEPSPGGLSIAGVGPVAEGFVAWLVGIGLLLAVVRWVESRRRPEEEDAEASEAG